MYLSCKKKNFKINTLYLTVHLSEFVLEFDLFLNFFIIQSCMIFIYRLFD